MAEIIRMPKMSDTMTEGTIAAWHKKVGDTVKSGDLLAEVETDKATMELESYNDGTILYIGVEKGASVAVDGILAIVGDAGEDYSSALKGSEVKAVEVAKASPEPAPNTSATPIVSVPAPSTEKVNAAAIRMPKMSDTMTDGTIVSWQKKVGDKVKSGELLAEVETDKATMELESYEDGTLLYIGVEAGNSVKVDDIIAIIGEAGANYKVLLQASSTDAVAQSAPTATTNASVQETVSSPVQVAEVKSSDDRIKVSPLAKKLADEKGLDIHDLKGSGDNGRIVKRDVESYIPTAKPAKTQSTTPAASAPAVSSAALGQVSFDEVPVSQMRKTIARRLAESMFTAPHFYLTMEINMDKAIEARKSINDYVESKISYNDMVIKAVSAALRKHPKVNSSWLGDKIRYNHHINIGMAVAVEEGLLVPVIRFADSKSLTQISAEAKDLGNRAKNKQLQPAEWEGNTFTISNLGMFGIEEFTAIINPPDACILAVGGIKETVIVKNGEMKVGNIMKVTLSCDHRVVDGAIGSSFLQTLKNLLEDPIRILA